MKTRTKKYYQKKLSDDGSKKGSANIGGYDEQNEITSKAPKENPAPSASEDKKRAKEVVEKANQKKSAIAPEKYK